jgi:hypothetical protein
MIEEIKVKVTKDKPFKISIIDSESGKLYTHMYVKNGKWYSDKLGIDNL